VAGEEATTTVTEPRRRDMIGPWVWAREERAQCGLGPSWWRFPIIGKPVGPGGWFFLTRRLRMNRVVTRNSVRSDRKMRRSMMKFVGFFLLT